MSDALRRRPTGVGVDAHDAAAARVPLLDGVRHDGHIRPRLPVRGDHVAVVLQTVKRTVCDPQESPQHTGCIQESGHMRRRCVQARVCLDALSVHQ